MSQQQHTRTLLGPADPAGTVTVAAPRLCAAALITQAEAATASAGGRRPTRRRVLVAAGTVVVVAVGGTAAYPLLRPDVARPPAGVADLGLVNPIAYQLDTGAPAAGPYLRELAAKITDAPLDRHSGTYAYVHSKSWGGMVVTSEQGYVMSYVLDTRAWLASDGSGRQRIHQLDPRFPDEASRRYWEKELKHQRPAATAAPDRGYDDIPAVPGGGLKPLPTDPAGMADVLGVAGGTADAIGNIFHVYEQYAVPRASRAAILTVLAGLDGVLWRGEVTDRAGRTGVAVTFDDSAEHQEQHLLIFDPGTGELLANELLGVGGLRRTVNYYCLYLETDRTDRLG